MGSSVLIAAGGTGGHVFPGLATAAALRDVWPDADVAFVGTADRLEARLVPQAGWTLHTVPAMALSRRVSPDVLRLPVVLGRAVRQVVGLIRAHDVDVAVGFGGYTSVPLALAARITRTPLVVHEQNAVPGIANKLAARAAAAVAVTFEAARDGFGRTPTVLTGNPIRPDLLPAPVGAPGEVLRAATAALRQEALAAFGLAADRRTLLVFGGSQGALRINTAMVQGASLWAAPGRLQILHAAGQRTHDETRQGWVDAGIDPDGAADDGQLKVVCTAFLDRMDLAYAAADVVVCRAGASSIAELTALAIPSVLVPYPHATADHQMANARAVAAAGGAVVLADADTTAATLVEAAEPLLTDPDRHASLVAGAAAFGRPAAAADLARLVADAATGRPIDDTTGATR